MPQQQFILKLPADYDSTKTYPLLVALHGNGGDAPGLAGVFNSFSGLPVIIAVPQGQYAKLDGGYSWYFETADRDLWETMDLNAAETVIETIKEVKKKHRIGDVYLFGFSQGASVAYMTGIKYPKVIKGIVAAGGVMPEIDVKGSVLKSADVINAVNVKILAARGMDDPYLKRSRFENQVEYLKKKNYNVTSFEYTGTHQVTTELLNNIFEWMGVR